MVLEALAVVEFGPDDLPKIVDAVDQYVRDEIEPLLAHALGQTKGVAGGGVGAGAGAGAGAGVGAASLPPAPHAPYVPAPFDCPGKHGLKIHFTDANDYSCAVCNAILPAVYGAVPSLATQPP